MALVRVRCPAHFPSCDRRGGRTLGGRRIYCARRVGHLIRSATDWVFQPRVTHSPPLKRRISRSLASTRQVFLLPTGGGWRGDRDPQLPLASPARELSVRLAARAVVSPLAGLVACGNPIVRVPAAADCRRSGAEASEFSEPLAASL
jgi:hypothetical protein